jgi:hypothetical protein
MAQIKESFGFLILKLRKVLLEDAVLLRVENDSPLHADLLGRNPDQAQRIVEEHLAQLVQTRQAKTGQMIGTGQDRRGRAGHVTGRRVEELAVFLEADLGPHRPVLSRRQARQRRGVADDDAAAGALGADDGLEHRGRQMVAVGDERGRQIVIGQTGPNGVVMSRQQGRHAVAEVREGLGPYLDELL